jgi:cytochrome c oxidase subunit IV
MYKNVCLNSLLMRQLKHRGFVCNALNCLYILFFILSTCSYILEYFFIFVNVIIKLLKKIVYEKKVQLLKDKSLP